MFYGIWTISTMAVVVLSAASVSTHDSLRADPHASSLRGCDITIQASNGDRNNIIVDLNESEVRIRNGLWSKIKNGGNWTVNPTGQMESKVVELNLGCSHQREYKFRVRRAGSERIVTKDWTSSSTFGLGDLARHFY